MIDPPSLSVQVDLTKIVIVFAFLFVFFTWTFNNTGRIIRSFFTFNNPLYRDVLFTKGYQHTTLIYLRNLYILILLLRLSIVFISLLVIHNLTRYFSIVEYVINPDVSPPYHLEMSVVEDAEYLVNSIIFYSIVSVVISLVDAVFVWMEKTLRYSLDDHNIDSSDFAFIVPYDWSYSIFSLWSFRSHKILDNFGTSDWSESWPEWVELVNKYRRS